MADEDELHKALQSLFERQYERRQTFKKWSKLCLVILVPIWVVATPIIWADGALGIAHGADLFLRREASLV